MNAELEQYKLGVGSCPRVLDASFSHVPGFCLVLDMTGDCEGGRLGVFVRRLSWCIGLMLLRVLLLACCCVVVRCTLLTL